MICEQPSNTFVFLFVKRVICLVITNLWLTVPCKSMQSYISVIPSFLSIEYEKVLHQGWLVSILSMAMITLQISLVSIGDTHRSGQDLKHCCFEWEIPWISKTKLHHLKWKGSDNFLDGSSTGGTAHAPLFICAKSLCTAFYMHTKFYV